ncbi:glycosyltransferase [Oscillatoria sp. CS-180]|uniref:glycosyltransferase n=1 Tax=Oscillatoria sp. CS-180 TaxID=3021720 RepID=UPI00232E5CB0|nr:glycosyltransferase [Oscillatoria sp. CS-180]MDB9528392.1 glycosyltransferase [Oscillatoria sp. CS-180]
MKIHVLSMRDIHAAPHNAPAFNIEDVIVDTCDANLIRPKARKITKSIDKSAWPQPIKNMANKFVRKGLGYYEPIDISKMLPSDETNVLILIGVHGAFLEILKSIPEWREKFDVVVAYIFDAWLVDAFPSLTQQLDHLFVPLNGLIEPLQKEFSIPVSYWPHSANVLDHGSANIARCIDIASYGRVPTQYHAQLFERCNQSSQDLFYYRQVPEEADLYPDEPYTPQRFDYQHKVLLKKILSRSKISLAFDFTYTSKGSVALSNYQEHPSYFYRKPTLTPRWFEGLASGTAIVGKRPPSKEADRLLDWKDATIELPDRPEEGVEAIMNLLADKERLTAIHRRNYWQMLKKHDTRWRVKACLDQLRLPIPSKLQSDLEKIDYQSRNFLAEMR